MDRRPIGVFDSGLGGLTAVRELARLMPEEELVYFGDTGRVPYGGRSRDILVQYARQDVRFLRSFDPKAIVIACGTVSSTALDVLRRENDIPVFGVVEPAARAAAECSANGRVGLIGTKATIRSGAYERELLRLRPDAVVTAEACPLFVPLVENGRFRPGDSVVETVAAEYLAPMKAQGVDTLILGCTHYPLIKEMIGWYMGKNVTLVDPAQTASHHLERTLSEHGLKGDHEKGEAHFYVSDVPDSFAQTADLFLGEYKGGLIDQVAIEKY